MDDFSTTYMFYDVLLPILPIWSLLEYIDLSWIVRVKQERVKITILARDAACLLLQRVAPYSALLEIEK